MARPKGKIERRLGENLFLKGHRCLGPKCPHARRPSLPGVHGKKKSRRASSEFGTQLFEKQKMKWRHGLSEKEIAGYMHDASQKSGKTTAEYFMGRVERRLDNAVFKSGFAVSLSIARHLIVYGHIWVNGKRVTKPSYAVRKGEIIQIRPASLSSKMFEELDGYLKKYEPPAWLLVDRTKKSVTVQDNPAHTLDPRDLIQVKPVVEFYSR